MRNYLSLDEQEKSAWQGLYLACFNKDIKSARIWIFKLLKIEKLRTIHG